MRYEPIHHTIVALDVVASGARDDQPLPEANLAVAVSHSIHDSVVRHGYGLDPATYQCVRVRVKETDTTAWIHVPGFRPPLPVGEPAAPPATPPAAPAVHNVASGSASVGAQIGIVRGNVYIGHRSPAGEG